MNQSADVAFDFVIEPEVIPLNGVSLSVREKLFMKHDEKGFSLIELLIVVAIIGIIAAIAIPNMIKSQQAAHETAAIGEIKTLGTSQITYQITKGRGKFGNLQALASEGIIDSGMASGSKGGYQYASDPLTADKGPSMYDTTAKPSAIGTFGTGNRSFGSNETNVIFEADGAVDVKGTATDRRPAGATPIQ